MGSSKKRGRGEIDEEEWDWEREVEEWDNERSRVKEAVEEWEEEVEREGRYECEGESANVTDEEWLQRVADAAEIEHAVGCPEGDNGGEQDSNVLSATPLLRRNMWLPLCVVARRCSLLTFCSISRCKSRGRCHFTLTLNRPLIWLLTQSLSRKPNTSYVMLTTSEIK